MLIRRHFELTGSHTVRRSKQCVVAQHAIPRCWVERMEDGIFGTLSLTA